MNLSIEAGALTVFWGSCLANLLWVNRQVIFSTTKKYASDAASYVINKSKKIIKKERRLPQPSHQFKEQPQQEKTQPASPPMLKHLNMEPEQDMQPQKVQEAPETKKKDRRKSRRHRNLRKFTKNYEDWLLRRAYLRRVEETPTNEFKEYLRQFQERKMSEQMFLSKPKEIGNIQDFEKYVQEQLDIDEQDEMECILPYDPFVSEEEDPKRQL